MAKVAAPTTLPSNSLQMGGGSHKVGLTVKRKTPSELRVSSFNYIYVIIVNKPCTLCATSSCGLSLKFPE